MTSRPLNVLVVDDHPDVRDSLARLLDGFGHRTQSAGSCAEAVAALDSFTPDAVIVDVALTDGNGYDLAAAICERVRPRPLVAVLTGFPYLADRTRGAGLDHHFLKPADPLALRNLLADHARALDTAG